MPRRASAVDHHLLIINGLSTHRLYWVCQVGSKHFEMFRNVSRLCSSVKSQCKLPFSLTFKLKVLIRPFFLLQHPHSLPILFRLQARLWILFLWVIRTPISTMSFPLIHPLDRVLACQTIMFLIRPARHCFFTVSRISTQAIASRRVPADEEEEAYCQSYDANVDAASDIAWTG